MKKTAILLAFLCMALAGNAQLLWKVSGNGLKEPSYIIGTHHVAPLGIKDSIAGLPAALEQAAQVYGEIKMKDMMNPDSLALMQQAMVLPGDVTLTSLYTPAQRDSVVHVEIDFLHDDLSSPSSLRLRHRPPRIQGQGTKRAKGIIARTGGEKKERSR